MVDEIHFLYNDGYYMYFMSSLKKYVFTCKCIKLCICQKVLGHSPNDVVTFYFISLKHHHFYCNEYFHKWSEFYMIDIKLAPVCVCRK